MQIFIIFQISFAAQVDKSANENMELKSAIKELEEKHQTVESEFKEKEMRFTAMKSQFDSKAEKMKATLNELRNENQSLSDRIRNLEEDKKYVETVEKIHLKENKHFKIDDIFMILK